MSVYGSILMDVQNTVEALSLGQSATRIRKLPRRDETLDTLPIIVIAPNDPERVTHSGFGQNMAVVYTVDIVWVGGGGAQTLANTTAVLDFREATRRAFQGITSMATANTVWMSEVVPDIAFDRGAVSRNYDYSGLRVRFHSNERRDAA